MGKGKEHILSRGNDYCGVRGRGEGEPTILDKSFPIEESSITHAVTELMSKMSAYAILVAVLFVVEGL